MRFIDIPGQQKAKEGIIGMWQNNHFPHALLLVGRDGVGGLPMALAIAQYIFCENRQETDSCGECASCSKVKGLEHPDLHLSFPSISPKPGTKASSKLFIKDFREFVQQTPYSSSYDWLQFINAENKQGNITAEECRTIIEDLNLKSYEGKGKVQIVWRPEYLGKEGNILLKLIEEPPANTFLIFVAEDLEEILPTILSRTQIIRLAPIPEVDIAQRFVAKGLADEARAAQVAHMSHGSYAEALRLLQHAGNDLFASVRTLFNAIFTNNGIALSKFAEEWSKEGREKQKNFLQYNIQLLEQAIRAKYLPDQEPSLPEAESQFVKKLASMNVSINVFNNMVEEMTDTIHKVERNAHSKTQLHALAIKLAYIVSNRPIPQL
ncbi:MAG: hypothetical protein R2800_00670 [Flavipsychrobacter sp.]